MRILQLHNADWRGVVQNNGDMICPLHEADQAIVRREINGEFSLTVHMPKGAKNTENVEIGKAIKSTINEDGDAEFFVVKTRQRSMSGGVTIYAEHQHYLFNGVIIKSGPAYSGLGPDVVFNNLRAHALPAITDISAWTYSRTSEIRANFPARQVPITLMTALKSHMIGNAGGELIFHGFDVEYVDQMGVDRGARFRYGLNLTELATEDILDEYASGIFPFWGKQGDQNRPMTILDDPVYPYTGSFPMQVIKPVDFTQQFDTQPSQADLQSAAAEYAARNAPTGFPLSIQAERANITGNTKIDLGDTVTVTYTPWGIDTKTRIYSLSFDALRGKVISAQFGTINPGFAGAIKNMI